MERYELWLDKKNLDTEQSYPDRNNQSEETPSSDGSDRDKMESLPAPPVSGNTDAERFDIAVRETFTVSKEEMQRREKEWQRTQDNNKFLEKS